MHLTHCDLYSFRKDTRSWTSNRHQRVTRRCFGSSATHGLSKMLESTALPFSSKSCDTWTLVGIHQSWLPHVTSEPHTYESGSSVLICHSSIYYGSRRSHSSVSDTRFINAILLLYTFKCIHSYMSLERHNSDFGMKWEVLVSCWFMNCGDNSFPSGNEVNRHLLEISVV